MEKLWSPWRSQYIQSFKEAKKKSNCIFCDAVSEDIFSDDSLVVRKAKLTFTVLNLYPYNNGHLMIVPNRHLNDFQNLTAEENAEIMSELQLAQKCLSIVSRPDGFNIGANIGKSSGAGIDDHIHFHIVPRWNGDTNFMPVLGEAKVLSQDLLNTKKELIRAYESVLNL
ncbi:MAG: HIT domain-containing protein [Ignavibacteriaceae bacterium]|nr:HIT domain-containing protein [Ignavibacteriaceae bacterium]